MNLSQKAFMLGVLSKVSLLGAAYFGFWAFIYEFAWWNKPFMDGLMSAGVNLIFAPVCFVSYLVLDTWAKHPEATIKIENGKK